MNPLLDQMMARADPTQVAGLARFFQTGPGQYGEGDRFLGIKVPVTRAVVRECWRSVDFYLAHTDRINNWDLVDLSCYPLLGEWLLDRDRTMLRYAIEKFPEPEKKAFQKGNLLYICETIETITL